MKPNLQISIVTIFILFISCNTNNYTILKTYENGKPKLAHLQDLNQTFQLEYYENGQLKSEGVISGDEKKGLWKYYHENGALAAEEFFVGGKQFEEAKYFHKNGELKEIGEFSEGGKKIGLWESFHDNGKLKSKGKYQAGFKSENWIYFDKQGQQIKKEKFGKTGPAVDIKVTDRDTIYVENHYENGILKSNETRVNGNRIDWFEYYDELGNLGFIGKFLPENKLQIFHDNGQLFAEGQYSLNSSAFLDYDFLNDILPFPFYFQNPDLIFRKDWLFFDKKGNEIANINFEKQDMNRGFKIIKYSFNGKNCTSKPNLVKDGKGEIRFCTDDEIVFWKIEKGLIVEKQSKNKKNHQKK